MVTIECLRTIVRSGATQFPLFIGFGKASELVQIASVPCFKPATGHSTICDNISSNPVREWQRPEEPDRITNIRGVFNNAGELMPNAVLLCENPLFPGRYEASSKLVGGSPAGTWEVKVDVPPPNTDTPLWIIDGQHRLNGLSQSTQANEDIPVVLLLNHQVSPYTGPAVAKVFAQVTTEAESLNDLHQEWLTYAFGLRDYDPTRHTTATLHKGAMTAVVELCKNATILNSTDPNPFYNRIQFNYRNPPSPPMPGPAGGGFQYDCKRLKELLLAEYYGQPLNGATSHLKPSDLAAVMARAYAALVGKVANARKSVFLGDKDHAQDIMQDAFWVGVLTALRTAPEPNWGLLFDGLKFPTSDWNFAWARGSLNGRLGTISKRVANAVLGEAFSLAKIPLGCGTLVECLKGKNASVVIDVSRYGKKRLKKHRISQQLKDGDAVQLAIGQARHVRIAAAPLGTSVNVANVLAVDRGSSVEDPVSVPVRNFLITGPAPGLVVLRYVMPHYGGLKSTAELSLNYI